MRLKFNKKNKFLILLFIILTILALILAVSFSNKENLVYNTPPTAKSKTTQQEIDELTEENNNKTKLIETQKTIISEKKKLIESKECETLNKNLEKEYQSKIINLRSEIKKAKKDLDAITDVAEKKAKQKQISNWESDLIKFDKMVFEAKYNASNCVNKLRKEVNNLERSNNTLKNDIAKNISKISRLKISASTKPAISATSATSSKSATSSNLKTLPPDVQKYFNILPPEVQFEIKMMPIETQLIFLKEMEQRQTSSNLKTLPPEVQKYFNTLPLEVQSQIKMMPIESQLGLLKEMEMEQKQKSTKKGFPDFFNIFG